MDYSKLLYNLNYTKQTGNNAGIDIAIQMIQDEIYKTEAKNAGRGSALSAAKKILNNNYGGDNKFSYPAYNIDNKQYICNGYALVVLNKPLPLENRPDNVSPLETAALDKCIKGLENNQITVDLPSISELKANLKIQKGKPKDKAKGYTYDFGEGLPMVNIEYLISILSLLPNCKTAKINDRFPTNTGLYFCDDDNGIGLLMPVRKI